MNSAASFRKANSIDQREQAAKNAANPQKDHRLAAALVVGIITVGPGKFLGKATSHVTGRLVAREERSTLPLMA